MSPKTMYAYKYAVAILIIGIVNAEFKRYRIYKEKKISASSPDSLKIKDTFRVSDPLFCTVECNKQSSCSVASIENDKDCTLFTNDTTLFDTEVSQNSKIMSQIEYRD